MWRNDISLTSSIWSEQHVLQVLFVGALVLTAVLAMIEVEQVMFLNVLLHQQAQWLARFFPLQVKASLI